MRLRSRLQDVVAVVLVLLAGGLAGAATLLLAQILRERSACLEDSAAYAGTCVLEQDGWLEYHYYFYPTTRVEAQEDASAYDDSEEYLQDTTSPSQGEFEPINNILI